MSKALKLWDKEVKDKKIRKHFPLRQLVQQIELQAKKEIFDDLLDDDNIDKDMSIKVSYIKEVKQRHLSTSKTKK